MPSRKKYQIFISSTFRDLEEERKAVTWALLKARHVPVGMEAFSATDDRGWKTIAATIDDSDYYVLIIAGKLGSVDDKTGKSWTRLEYEYAREKGIPVLAFVRDSSCIMQADAEPDPEMRNKLTDFAKVVQNTHLRERWTDKADLVAKVSTALTNHIQDDEHEGNERPGWYRGDELPASTEAMNELARLSRENSELRAELSNRDKPRPKLVVLYRGEVVGDTLTLIRPRLIDAIPKKPVQAYSFDVLGSSPDNTIDLINQNVWLHVALRNVGGAVARSLKVDVGLAWDEEVTIQPPSSRIVSPWRTNPSEHVYIDSYGRGSTTQRVKSANVGANESLLPFAVRIPEGMSTRSGVSVPCTIVASDEGGEVLSKTFTIVLEPGEMIQVQDASELKKYDGGKEDRYRV